MSASVITPDDDDDEDKRFELSARADQFFAALTRGQADDWSPYLSGLSGEFRLAVLIELVLIDLGYRWGKGERPTIEQYVARFPELGPAHKVPAKLIVEEYRCRLRAGMPADIDNYRSRFPVQFSAIEPELQASGAHTLLPASGPASSGPALGSSGRSEGLQSVADQYEFVRELGHGMFGEVWLARKKTSGIEKAIKILLQPADRDVAKRELRSLELIKNLRHHYLLATEDFWVASNRLHIA